VFNVRRAPSSQEVSRLFSLGLFCLGKVLATPRPYGPAAWEMVSRREKLKREKFLLPRDFFFFSFFFFGSGNDIQKAAGPSLSSANSVSCKILGTFVSADGQFLFFLTLLLSVFSFLSFFFLFFLFLLVSVLSGLLFKRKDLVADVLDFADRVS